MDFDFQNELQANQHANEDGYYQEYSLTNQIKDLIEQKNHLKHRLSKYQDQECLSSFERNQKAKRFRRNAHEIERFYKCTVRSCAKSYGSEGSLNQHYKLKHPQIYATLPNVQSTCEQRYQTLNVKLEDNIDERDYIRNSTSKVNSILKQMGDIKSFRSIKIEELKFQADQNKQNKENRCQNMLGNSSMKGMQGFKDQFFSKPKQFLTLIKKEETNVTQSANNLNLKRSSRTIKKKDYNNF